MYKKFVVSIIICDSIASRVMRIKKQKSFVKLNFYSKKIIKNYLYQDARWKIMEKMRFDTILYPIILVLYNRDDYLGNYFIHFSFLFNFGREMGYCCEERPLTTFFFGWLIYLLWMPVA